MRRLLSIFVALCALGAHAQTATPCAFSPAGGTYSTGQSVTLSSTGAIFYTTNGSTPNLTSTLYTAPISVTATTTIKCVTAAVGFTQTNAQNNNPSTPGTFWKNADCASFAGWSSSTAYGVGGRASQGGFNWSATAANTNKQPSSNPTFWHKFNSCTADDPGGSGVPSINPTHTSGNAVPSLSGASMLFATSSEPGKQTNMLWPPSGVFGSCNACTYFLEDHYYYWNSANSSANEDDSFSFDTTSHIRYMKGLQYCFGAGCPGGSTGWDYGGNSNVAWTPTGVSAGGTLFTWHHLQILFHRIPAEETTKPCTASGTWPYVYFDLLVVDGVPFGPWKFCANALPGTWGSVAGPQAQIDIGSHTPAVASQVYWDYINFMALFNPTVPSSATYTISAGFTPPLGLKGSITVKGHAALQ